MSAKGWRRSFLPAGLLAVSLSGLAADGGRPRFELFIGGGAGAAGGSTTYANAYDPHPGYAIAGSYVRQTLAVEPALGGHLSAGGTLFLGRSLGVRLSFHHDSRAIGGNNAPYDYLYLYTSMTPPDYTPIETSYARQVDWASSEGRVSEYGARLELVWRRTVSSRLEVALAGGLSLTSTSGRLHPLGFTDQWQGGHGVLFIEDYLVYLRLPARTLAGAALSVEASIRLSEHFRLRLEAGYLQSAAYEAVPEIDKILSYYSLDEAGEEIARMVESRFDLRPLRLSPSRASIGAAVVFRF